MPMKSVETIECLHPDWDAPANIHALVTTRTGGVSESPWDSLNLATHVNDSADAVQQNRTRLRQALSLPVEPHWLSQVHGTTVVDVSLTGHEAEADAAIAFDTAQVCVVMTADCLPVFFCTRAGDRVAVAHAGWRGLLAGVLEATVKKLKVEPSDLMAWLGPAIGPKAFEVGNEVREAFVSVDAGCAGAFVEGSDAGHFYADIYKLARVRLNRMGVTKVSGGEFCTYSDKERFFSYRRDGQCGRMASLIWID